MTKTTYISIIAVLLVPIFGLRAEEGTLNANMRMSVGLDRVATVTATSAVGVDGPRMEMKDARREMRDENKQDRKEMKDALKLRMDARKAELKTEIDALRLKFKDSKAKRLDDNARERVQARLNNIYDRLDGRLDTLGQVDTAITLRLSRYATSGISVSPVTALQVPSQALLAKARVDVEAIKAASIAEIATSTSKEALRGLVEKAEVSVRAAAESYRKTIEALKALPKLRVTATSTATTTVR